MSTTTKNRRLLRFLVPALILLLVGLAAMAVSLQNSRVAPTAETTDAATTTATIAETEPATTLPPPAESEYTPTDFAVIDGYMACLSGPYRLGVDVSSWQKTVDWQQVKDAGMDFAMIRFGYRGYGQGGIFADDYAASNYRNATAAGLDVGGYFFSQAITPEEAREEAHFVLNMIKDWDIQMPIVYDWEYINSEARTAHVDGQTLTACTIAFCEEIRNAGYEAMIYFNPDLERKQMSLEKLTDYKFWLAMYSDEMSYPYRVDMWQYTCTGSVPGINGNCDINLMFIYE